MLNRRLCHLLGTAAVAVTLAACDTPAPLTQQPAGPALPATYVGAPTDSTTSARLAWKEFFTDPNLQGLIDTALQQNQELSIAQQEIEIARNEVRARKGEYMPFLGLGVRADAEKPGRYTLRGATEEAIPIEADKRNPEPLANIQVGAMASWEVDIWHKLRNARKAAAMRYLASVEGRNFSVTNLVAEIANSYYELLALDYQLAIVQQNIAIQRNALEAVKLQKESARVTELAVQRFEAQVQNSLSRQYSIQQRIVETENHINFLTGRYPHHVPRTAQVFTDLAPPAVQMGVPPQLLQNRADVRRAERLLDAAHLDVRVARANFYPALRLSGGIGYEAYRASLLFTSPESFMYSLGGDLLAPLVNRNGIKAVYNSANAKQLQALYDYQRTLLNAYVEVANQQANIRNLAQSYDAKLKEVAALNQSVDIANNLFTSARAEYTEVLFTQRDALESKFDLTEIKLQQLNAAVNVYRALGGGWR